MPMTPQVRGIARNCDVMTQTRRDLSVTARADVGLRRLVGLNSPHLDRPIATVPQPLRARSDHVQPKNAHTTSAAAVITAAETNK